MTIKNNCIKLHAFPFDFIEYQGCSLINQSILNQIRLVSSKIFIIINFIVKRALLRFSLTLTHKEANQVK
jgi:hypothetical protein